MADRHYCRFCTKHTPVTEAGVIKTQGLDLPVNHLIDRFGDITYCTCKDAPASEWFYMFVPISCERYEPKPITAADLDYWENFISNRWPEYTALSWVIFEVTRTADTMRVHYNNGFGFDITWLFKVGDPAENLDEMFNQMNNACYNWSRLEQLAKDPDPVFHDDRPDCEIAADGYSPYSRPYWKGGVGW